MPYAGSSDADPPMIVLVYGGRRYQDRARVFAELDAIHALKPITLLIQGEATGADAYGKAWARAHDVLTSDFAADWNNMEVEIVRPKRRADGSVYNAAAGGIRNRRMMDEGKPDLALEFPGGSGTANMREIVLAEQSRRDSLLYIRIMG